MSVTISAGYCQRSHKHSFHTSQKTYYFSTTKTNRGMLFEEKTVCYCDNSIKYTTKLCGQNSELYYVQVCVAYSAHWGLKNYYTEREINLMKLSQIKG